MDIAHSYSDKELYELEKELTKIYKEATKELKEKLKKQLEDLLKWEEKNEKLKAENIEEYNLQRQNKLIQIDTKKNIIENISKDILYINEQVIDIINDVNLNIYSANYNYILKSLNKQGANISFEIYNKQIVANLIKKNTNLFPTRKIDVAKDLLWNNKKIKSEMIKGIVKGESLFKIANRLENVTDMNKKSSIRNARTAITNVESKARQDGFAYAENLGIELQKKWISTNDARTRDSHAFLNGEIVDTNSNFSNGLCYPGDPSGAPAEVYNCRCTIGSILKKNYKEM
ncbi:MAG: phage minor head protein [Clostridia bacterium]